MILLVISHFPARCAYCPLETLPFQSHHLTFARYPYGRSWSASISMIYLLILNTLMNIMELMRQNNWKYPCYPDKIFLLQEKLIPIFFNIFFQCLKYYYKGLWVFQNIFWEILWREKKSNFEILNLSLLLGLGTNGLIEKQQNESEACNFIKSNPHPWVFFTFFILYRWYQIAQRITYSLFYSIENIETGGNIGFDFAIKI